MPYLLFGSGRGTASPGRSGMRVLPGPSFCLLEPQLASVMLSSINKRWVALRCIATNFKCDFLAELVNGKRVHHAVVVASDDKEIVKAHPVLIAISTLECQ